MHHVVRGPGSCLMRTGQLLDEDLTKCSELHNVTSSSHCPRNVLDLEQFIDGKTSYK